MMTIWNILTVTGIIVVIGIPLTWLFSRVQMKAWIHTIDKHLNKIKHYGKEEK